MNTVAFPYYRSLPVYCMVIITMLAPALAAGQSEVAPDAVRTINGRVIYARVQPTTLGTVVESGIWEKAGLQRKDSILAFLERFTAERIVQMNSDTSSTKDSSPWIVKTESVTITLDSITKHCDGSLDQACRDWVERKRALLSDEIRSIQRSFTLTRPIKESESVFKRLLINDLDSFTTAASPAGTDSSGRMKDIRAFVDAFYWQSVAVIVADPTPIATTICIGREVPVRRRLSQLDAWVKREISKNPWLPTGTILLPAKHKARKGDLVAELWGKLRAFAEEGKADSTKAVQKRLDALWESNPALGLSYRRRTFTYSRSDRAPVVVRALIPVREDRKRIYSKRLYHGNSSSLQFMSQFEGGLDDKVRIDRVQMKFEDGAINSVVVNGTVVTNGVEVMFSNSGVPIPFKRMRDLYQKRLDRFPLYGTMGRSHPGKGMPPNVDYVLTLSDLIKNIPALQERTDNLAPGDSVATWNFTDSEAGTDERICLDLRKEATRDLLMFKVFTDPIGLARNKPNGLIQTEMGKRIPLFAPRSYTVNKLRYVEPVFGIQLLNEEERRLTLQRATDSGPIKVRAMEQLNAATWNIDLKLNMASLTWHSTSTEVELNALCGFRSTYVSDSVLTAATDSSYRYSAAMDSLGNAYLDSTLVPKEGDVWTTEPAGALNSFTFGMELRWRIKPDGRYGIDLYGGVAHYVLLAPKERYVTDLLRADEFPALVFAGIDGWFRPNRNDSWFFRTRYTGDSVEPSNHFVQLQLGYNRRLNYKVKESAPPTN
jgi:hypothetical protein